MSFSVQELEGGCRYFLKVFMQRIILRWKHLLYAGHCGRPCGRAFMRFVMWAGAMDPISSHQRNESLFWRKDCLLKENMFWGVVICSVMKTFIVIYPTYWVFLSELFFKLHTIAFMLIILLLLNKLSGMVK